jgi:hypothetical protein
MFAVIGASLMGTAGLGIRHYILKRRRKKKEQGLAESVVTALDFLLFGGELWLWLLTGFVGLLFIMKALGHA